MKKFWLLALAVPLFVFSAPSAEAVLVGACPSGGTTTYQTYLDLTAHACTIDDKTFSGFGIGSTDILASAISVTTLNDGTNFGFRFQFPLAASTPNQTKDLNLEYNVATTDGSARITDVKVFQAGSATGSGSFASVDETICIGGFFPGCAGGVIGTLHTDTSDPGDELIFGAPVSRVGLLKDIVVHVGDCGTATNACNATLSIVSNTVSQTVPEPATLLLLGSGLVGVATWSRKKFRK